MLKPGFLLRQEYGYVSRAVDDRQDFDRFDSWSINDEVAVDAPRPQVLFREVFSRVSGQRIFAEKIERLVNAPYDLVGYAEAGALGVNVIPEFVDFPASGTAELILAARHPLLADWTLYADAIARLPLPAVDGWCPRRNRQP